MAQFRVVDVRRGAKTEASVNAKTPVEAGETSLGLMLTRSGSAKSLVCKVYWKNPDAENLLNMVRLYERKAQ